LILTDAVVGLPLACVSTFSGNKPHIKSLKQNIYMYIILPYTLDFETTFELIKYYIHTNVLSYKTIYHIFNYFKHSVSLP